ncbi:MAG: thioesterase family protein [Myxococcota bacterium]|nr:thioesterase family protein [Myxococcota bacterium]
MPTRFDRDTAVTPAGPPGEGRFDARIDPGWWIVNGPNGGYLAAIVLRALEARVDDPARAPRSLTLHYLRPPQEGPARVETRLERVGRTLTSATARLVQDDRVTVLALAAFATGRSAPELRHATMPEVAPPASLPRLDPALASIPMRARYESRWALGAPPGTGRTREALAGGWIRLEEPAPLDAPRVAALTDAWPPAVFSSAEMGMLAGGAPTLDLTIHFRTTLPLPGARDDDYVLCVFRSREARDGFVEEDGELWSRDGVLIAQSRQLALLA